MSDTDKIKPFKRSPIPAMEASLPNYLQREFLQLEATINSLREVIAKLEARLAALEPP